MQNTQYFSKVYSSCRTLVIGTVSSCEVGFPPLSEKPLLTMSYTPHMKYTLSSGSINTSQQNCILKIHFLLWVGPRDDADVVIFRVHLPFN